MKVKNLMISSSAIALSVFGLTGCSGSEEETVNKRTFNCALVQQTYDTLGADRTDPEAILYCSSIGQLQP
jgi:hypothetical protein